MFDCNFHSLTSDHTPASTGGVALSSSTNEADVLAIFEDLEHHLDVNVDTDASPPGSLQIDSGSLINPSVGQSPDADPPISIAEHLVSLLGGDVVLVGAPRGVKGPRHPNWQKTDIESMYDPEYVRTLDDGCNIAVLLGAHSSGLCSIDIDNDDDVEPFLGLNPSLAGTLRSRGQRGCNLWARVTGGFPPTSFIKNADGRKWGEFRSTGACTMIHGVHPSGMNYERSPEVPPIAVAFEDILWPDELILPWLPGIEDFTGSGDESDAQLVLDYGSPVFYSAPSEDGHFVKSVNEAYWAGLYAAENTVLFEPAEKSFYSYNDATGLYSAISPDAIKQSISGRMLEISRQAPSLSKLENHRTDRILGSFVGQLRGIAEHRDAFIDRPRTVHLANCILRFEGGQCFREEFSPVFYSRNRSPIAFDPDATCQRFLTELILPALQPDDVVLLQKMAGQYLLGTNLIQRFLILLGTPGGGKSQACNVLQSLIGLPNVTQLRTDYLGDRFELFRFLHRTLLVGVDVNADFLASKGAPVIKGLVGGDWHDAEQKGGTGSFQFQGKFNILITTNCRLKVKLQGDVGAWGRRLLIVPYEAQPPQRKIPNFGELLIREEGPGILNWALQGLGLLLADIEAIGDIRLTSRQASVVDSLLAESDSLRFFLRDNVVRREGANLSVNEIMQAYARYCPERGWEPFTEGQITRQLPSLMLELFQVARVHDCGPNRKIRGFHSVTFTTPNVLS